jgi:hypothetical protein
VNKEAVLKRQSRQAAQDDGAVAENNGMLPGVGRGALEEGAIRRNTKSATASNKVLIQIFICCPLSEVKSNY